MNRNGNQRRSATITFASEKEMEAAQTKPIRFNNHLLFWQEESREKKHSERKVCYQGYINTYNIEENSDAEEYKNKRSERRNDTEESKKNREKHRIYSTEKEEPLMRNQDLLEKILERLERLELQQSKVKRKTDECLASRS
jgi:ribosomal protein S4